MDARQDGVKVRALVWEPLPDGAVRALIPELKLGYVIAKIGSKWVPQWDDNPFQYHATPLDDAKAAAQADFERRILSALEPTPSHPALVKALRDIADERERQQSVEGWTPEHDDKHFWGELASAAACYALSGSISKPRAMSDYLKGVIRYVWPWDLSWWKPTDRRRDLVKAGALIVAEIERLDRAALATVSEPAP